MILNKRKKGFTLIELLLVVLIIGLITLYATNAFRSSTRNEIIINTKNQMENWLQAISSYYVLNNEWPRDLSDLIDNKYIKESAECSLLPGTSSLSICPNKSIYTLACPQTPCNLKTNQFIGIQLTMPSVAAANDLVAVLSSSSINDTTVTAEVPIPAIVSTSFSQSRAKGWGWIESAGLIHATHENCNTSKLDAKIVLPNCPKDYEGHYMQFYQKQRTGMIIPHTLGGTSAQRCEERIATFGDECCTENILEQYYIYFDFHNLFGLSAQNQSAPYVTVAIGQSDSLWNFQYNSFITFCIPNGYWNPAGASRDEAKQCTGDWLKYNKGVDVSCEPPIQTPDYSS